MMACQRIMILALLCAAALVTAACSSSPRVDFYTLVSVDRPGSAVPVKAGHEVTVGPITLPELVDRPQLVLRTQGNQVDILETHRWAEPLKSQIPRTLADDLGKLLGSERVSAYPQSAGSEADYRVLVDIQRFEAGKDGVFVDAFWTIRRPKGGAPKAGRSQAREPVSGSDYDLLVTAYSRALFSISSDIAAALRSEAVAAP